MRCGCTVYETWTLVLSHPLGPFSQTPNRLTWVFHRGEASGWPPVIKPDRCSVAVMFLPLEVSPISTQDLWISDRVSIRFLITSLTKALLPRMLSLAGWPALGRVHNFRIMEASMLLGTFKAAEFFKPSPDLCLDTIPSLCSSASSSFNHMACFLLWYALSAVRPYMDRWMPFQITSNQPFLPQVDSNQGVETSQRWSREMGGTCAKFQVS